MAFGAIIKKLTNIVNLLIEMVNAKIAANRDMSERPISSPSQPCPECEKSDRLESKSIHRDSTANQSAETRTSPQSPQKNTPNVNTRTSSSPFPTRGMDFTYGWEKGQKSTSPHWPPNDASGVTIGGGYDMGSRDLNEVYKDLVGSGVEVDLAEIIAQGAGKQGRSANKHLDTTVLYKGNTVRYGDLKITEKQQEELFLRTYPWYAEEARRLATKNDVTQKFGETNWDTLDAGIKDVIIDMRFRGDYSPQAREFKAPGDSKMLQEYIADNDVDGFKRSLTAYHKTVVDKADSNIKNGLRNRFSAREELL
jgi:hypothetical protein